MVASAHDERVSIGFAATAFGRKPVIFIGVLIARRDIDNKSVTCVSAAHHHGVWRNHGEIAIKNILFSLKLFYFSGFVRPAVHTTAARK